MAPSIRSAWKSLHKVTSQRLEPTSFKTVKIADRYLRVNLSTLDTFFKWMAERDRIRKKRSNGKPPPWSQDPTFNSHKFCHVFRIFDRGSQFLLHNVINKGSQEHREVCFRVILFKLFNRASTWDALQKDLGPLAWATFNLKAYARVLKRVAQDNAIYTSAYQIPPPNLTSGPGFKSHLLVLQMMMQDDLPGKLLTCTRMQDAYELFKIYPGLGQFLSYQMVLDINMSPEINFSENEWAVCGPGSSDCLKRIFGERVRGVETEAIKYLHQTQAEHYARLRITDPPGISASRSGVSFVDIEHSLCECSKYLRRRDQKGSWQASEELITSDLPAKWAQEASPGEFPGNKRLSASDSELSDSDDDSDVYEVSHIVRERQMSSGGVEYRIRWTGYGSSEDSWMSETALEDAPEVLKLWRVRRSMEAAINLRSFKARSSNHPRRKIAQLPTSKRRIIHKKLEGVAQHN